MSFFETFFWPRRGRVGVRSSGGALYLMMCIVETDAFMSIKDETSELAIVGPV